MTKRKPLVFESIFNSYREITVLGEGGSGKVYQVEDDDARTFALKYLDPQKVTKEKTKRFKNELFFCSQYRHDNIVRVLDWGDVLIDGVRCPFYVMPYYSQTLRKLIQNELVPQKVLPLFSQILNGVEAAHLQKVWHRDLKPENILYDDKADRLVIADFGIAHFSEDFLQTSLQTRTGARLANFQYAAPEQRNQGIVDHRADIYSLGMILNEMYTGMLLQGTGFKTIGTVAPDFLYLDDLVELMVRQSPAERPQSIDDIKKQLIGRGNEFVSRQKLSEFKKTVIPHSELDDPLVNNPVTLIDFDFINGHLILKLSPSPTAQWIDAFRTIVNVSYYPGQEPVRYQFLGNTASIPAGEQYVQQIINSFKDYLKKANDNYKRRVLDDLQQREAVERRALQEKTKEEEMRQRILKSVRI